MTDVYIAPGVRTPFVKSHGSFSGFNALDLSVPVAKAMSAQARPDFIVWGQVIPDPTISNIARELIFEAGLDPGIPSFSTMLACSTSFVGVMQAAGMIGNGGARLALVGGVETMSHVPFVLKRKTADGLLDMFGRDAAKVAAAMGSLSPTGGDLLIHSWSSCSSGLSQGEHTEETARRFGISRAEQDAWAFKSHQRAIASQDDGFFEDLIIPFAGVNHDTIPCRGTSAERLAALPPAFDRESGKGTLTAGNSFPITDGAAGVWVGDREGIARTGATPIAQLVDWEMAAMDFRKEGEGILMAPGRAIPRLLARHRLRFSDVALFEVHEAFAAQVIGNFKAASDPVYCHEKAHVAADLGVFDWSRVNPCGGSLALGHPFAATGARILSQAVKQMTPLPSGSLAIVSVCADGGQGTVALLRRAPDCNRESPISTTSTVYFYAVA